MGDRLIKLPLAKLAKERGFDAGVWDVYNGKGKLMDYRYNIYQYTNDGKFISAPTQTTLQTWLRDEHKIDVFANSVRFIGYLEIGFYTYTVRGNTPPKSYRYDTYEEALEAGLEAGLEEMLKEKE